MIKILNSDEIILNILNNAKIADNDLLKYFHISYPDKRLAQENNCIFVAVVSSENKLNGVAFEQFRDLVEILVTTKQEDNRDAIKIIKGVSYEICRLIMEHASEFPNKPIIRNINPYFDIDLTLSRGQIMVNVNTEPVDWDIDTETFNNVCDILVKNINEE